MTAILVDIGRKWLRVGLMNNDDAIMVERRVETASVGDNLLDFLQTELDSLHKAGERDVAIVLGAPGPFSGGIFTPMAGNDALKAIRLHDLREKWPNTYVVHDVVGGAFSTAHLRQGDFRLISADTSDNPVSKPTLPEPNASTLYIQTGIGLGACALVPLPSGGRMPFSSEGGSMTIAPHPKDEDEQRVYEALSARSDNEWGYVTAQYLLSAPTLSHIYSAIPGAEMGVAHERVPALAQRGDECARRAMRVFAGFLGTVAGDMALSFRAYSGVYIGGPIIGQLEPDICAKFLERFSERGEQNRQLRDVPAYAVTDEFNALLGLREVLREVRKA